VINPKNTDENNEFTIPGTDFFADSESFLNELTDDELHQVRGGIQGLSDDAFNNNNEGASEKSYFMCGWAYYCVVNLLGINIGRVDPRFIFIPGLKKP